ncbi:uncharacterized protein LOC110705956 [Chenopodium quinoa]|uniref:uncharacterized protein LOC110705956 n=1 Tax=Chenopodium quinoa TaxID=63459 RepID=UPI000B793510|nr:uncharacterized protein LOC110705956 [Chenopodium quinoa]XP_021739569.1 uncharacterized protein LOC110705956 [Chenopodium quinoa]XP_021739570.1 uncharacterized protein LOC110705956 [Chenopodium quinoa]
MDSPQSVVSPFKNLTVSGAEPEKQRSEVLSRGSSTHIANGTDKNEVNGNAHNPEDYIGTLDVYVHQARDIQNICIYHKQDVYAKLCLTSDPETTVSTQTINGGGRNPVFNQSLQLNVRTAESSLKCEIWMLSRVRNYLEDQLLGFALVPLSEILVKNGNLEKEFTLSSTDLFHSPSGFVQLSLSYSGASPEVIEIPKLSMDAENAVQDSEAVKSVPSEFDKFEFPDPNIVNENQMMVSEYFGMSLESQTTESLVSSDNESHELGVRIVESFSANSEDSKPILNADSPPSSVSTNGSPSVCLPTSSQCSEAPVTSKSPSQEHVSPLKDNKNAEGHGESNSANVSKPSKDTTVTPLVTVNVEPEEKMVQQEFVNMYMKSMQQFTESLAKMKLPMDLAEPEPTKSGDSSSDQKLETPKSAGSRVFYGSRAFF